MGYPLSKSRFDVILGAAGTTPRAGTTLCRKGSLLVRLAKDAREIEAAQRLRYRVFFTEGAAQAAGPQHTGRDVDLYDDVCDHLIVVDTEAGPSDSKITVDDGGLVGTYRLLPEDRAKKYSGFYTQGEFDLEPLLCRHAERRFMELGRSCVLREYRHKMVVETLWQGIWNYVRHCRFDVLFGCASFEGTDPDKIRQPLSFLARETTATPAWQVSAHPKRGVAMERMPGIPVDTRQAIQSLPPLIKGYLRLGAMTGGDAVVDHGFNTTDVLVILPVERIHPRYFRHFGAPDEAPPIL